MHFDLPCKGLVAFPRQASSVVVDSHRLPREATSHIQEEAVKRLKLQ